MKISEMKCDKCGQNPAQVAERGAHLGMVNLGEVPMILRCVPSCEHNHGGQDEAMSGAVLGVPNNEASKGEK